MLTESERLSKLAAVRSEVSKVNRELHFARERVKHFYQYSGCKPVSQLKAELAVKLGEAEILRKERTKLLAAIAYTKRKAVLTEDSFWNGPSVQISSVE